MRFFLALVCAASSFAQFKDGSTNTLLSKLLLDSPCPWDITEDDVVDVGDILILIAAWGACPS
jgi:hypothetical protein